MLSATYAVIVMLRVGVRCRPVMSAQNVEDVPEASPRPRRA
jgi:hypothetical protein